MKYCNFKYWNFAHAVYFLNNFSAIIQKIIYYSFIFFVLIYFILSYNAR